MKTKMTTKVAEIAAAGYFCSGVNDAGEVEGVAMGGYHIGVSCERLSEAVLAECERMVDWHRCNLFVDSGAFAEVEFVPGQGLVTKRELTDADWQARLATYRRLALSCGGCAYLVAPDRVGDQAETLLRMARYGATMRELREIHGAECADLCGPRIIVPVQNGAMTAGDFAAAALEALGFSEDEIVWGIPSKKGATTVEQLRAFAATCQSDASFHLLGMGPASPRFAASVEAILAECPDATITCDAVRITALVGRNPVRPLTAAQDTYRAANPGATGSATKRWATRKVLGDESVALLLDNGWSDPELAKDAEVTVSLESFVGVAS